MLAVLLNVMTPVVLCTALGYLWGRSPLAYPTDFITTLITLVGAPCLIIATINGADLDWAVFREMALLTLLMIAGIAATGAGLLRLLGMDVRALGLAVAVPNTGNMGLSLCLFAFGQEGLALALIVFVVFALVHFMVGDVVLNRGGSLRQCLALVARQPLVYAALIAMALVATRWKLPVPLADTLSLLGGITIPLMLITLGVSLSRLGLGSWRGGLRLAGVRFIAGLVASVAVVWLLGVGGLPASVLILQAMMPSAVFNYLFAVRHDRQPEVVASGVIISTFLSLLILPVLIGLLMNIFPGG